MKWIEQVWARETIADLTEKANEQHYEVRFVCVSNALKIANLFFQVSTSFILSCLGPYAKYSSCLYPTGKETLEEAEVLMLDSYCEKAHLVDGLDILDLGCGVYFLSPIFVSLTKSPEGWGSLSLYLAQVCQTQPNDHDAVKLSPFVGLFLEIPQLSYHRSIELCQSEGSHRFDCKGAWFVQRRGACDIVR